MTLSVAIPQARSSVRTGTVRFLCSCSREAQQLLQSRHWIKSTPINTRKEEDWATLYLEECILSALSVKIFIKVPSTVSTLSLVKPTK